MIYLYPVKSDMGMCAIYLGYFEKFADRKHTQIYITLEQIDRVIAWADSMGIS